MRLNEYYATIVLVANCVGFGSLLENITKQRNDAGMRVFGCNLNGGKT